jgi:hypothetical protein
LQDQRDRGPGQRGRGEQKGLRTEWVGEEGRVQSQDWLLPGAVVAAQVSPGALAQETNQNGEERRQKRDHSVQLMLQEGRCAGGGRLHSALEPTHCAVLQESKAPLALAVEVEAVLWRSRSTRGQDGALCAGTRLEKHAGENPTRCGKR